MSLINLHLIDGNGQPVKNAQLNFYKGNAMLYSMPVPDTGTVSLDTTADYITGSTAVSGNAFGYTTAQVGTSDLVQYNDYTFTMPANGLGKVLLVGAGIGLGALYLITDRGKRKEVSGFETLPPAAKDAIIIGGVGLALYLVFFAGSSPAGASLIPAANAQLDTLSAAGQQPSWTAAQVEAFAGSLRDAFNDCGTDNAAVTRVMSQMNNDYDIYQLISVYGTRGYKGCFDGDYFADHNYNLVEAMTSELSAAEIAAVNAQLSAVGITFKF